MTRVPVSAIPPCQRVCIQGRQRSRHYRRIGEGRARGVPDGTVIRGESRSLSDTPLQRSPAAGQIRQRGPRSLQAGDQDSGEPEKGANAFRLNSTQHDPAQRVCAGSQRVCVGRGLPIRLTQTGPDTSKTGGISLIRKRSVVQVHVAPPAKTWSLGRPPPGAPAPSQPNHTIDPDRPPRHACGVQHEAVFLALDCPVAAAASRAPGGVAVRSAFRRPWTRRPLARSRQLSGEREGTKTVLEFSLADGSGDERRD